MIGLVSFNDSAYAYNDTLTKATTANLNMILSYMEKIIASGSVNNKLILNYNFRLILFKLFKKLLKFYKELIKKNYQQIKRLLFYFIQV